MHRAQPIALGARCGDRRLIAESVVWRPMPIREICGRGWRAASCRSWAWRRHRAPFRRNARAHPSGGQPLTDTRRLFSGVRKFAGRLHVSIDGAAFTPGASDPQPGAPAAAGALSLAADAARDRELERLDRAHHRPVSAHSCLAEGVWSGIGCNGRGLAMASILGRDLAHLARGGSEADTVFPVTPLRPFPVHDAAAPSLPRRSPPSAGWTAWMPRDVEIIRRPRCRAAWWKAARRPCQ